MGYWFPIQSAPADRPLQLCVIDQQGEHCLNFPCRRAENGWANAVTGSRVIFQATHWREWKAAIRSASVETETRMRVNQLLIGAELATLYEEFLQQPIPAQLSALLDQLAAGEVDHLARARITRSRPLGKSPAQSADPVTKG